MRNGIRGGLMHSSIIRQIRELGYAVSVHEMKGGIHITERELPVADAYTELHAVKIDNPDEQHIARVDETGEAALYLAAVELTGMVGIKSNE